MKRINKAPKLQDSSVINGYFLTFMLLFIGSVVFRMVAASISSLVLLRMAASLHTCFPSSGNPL